MMFGLGFVKIFQFKLVDEDWHTNTVMSVLQAKFKNYSLQTFSVGIYIYLYFVGCLT
jgi:hypothetical protein